MSKKVYLPSPAREGGLSLEEVISRRKSVRNFTGGALTLAELSQLLWVTQGLLGGSLSYRAVPSAGATYPLEVYLVCGEGAIENTAAGIYHYHSSGHYISLHVEGDVRQELARAALNQNFICKAPINIVICADYKRTTGRYGKRGERYVHMEAGHASQNIYLQSVAMGLATVAVGAFDDARVANIMRLDERFSPLYIMPVGRQA